MKHTLAITAFAAAIASFSLPVALHAQAQSPVGVVNTQAGQAVAAVDTGMTLYTFAEDGRNVSTCTGGCARNWPPFLAPAAARPVGGMGIIDRGDGTRQWTMNGAPLYFFQGDTSVGDAAGQGLGGVWYIAELPGAGGYGTRARASASDGFDLAETRRAGVIVSEEIDDRNGPAAAAAAPAEVSDREEVAPTVDEDAGTITEIF